MSRRAYLRIPGQKRSADHLEITEQGKNEREFEGQPEPKDKKGAEGDVLPCGEHGFDVGRLIPKQKTDPERERHKVTEESPR